MEVPFRRRINVSTSAKGVKIFDCTVESENSSMEDLLVESYRLVAELDKRYPTEPEAKKEK